MSLVDSYFLKWEVKAEYPYGTTTHDTEQSAINQIERMRRWKNVACEVRVVGETVQMYGTPDRYPITDLSLLRDYEDLRNRTQ